MSDEAFLAIDWGTTNRRVFAIDAQAMVVASEHSDRGVLAVGADGFATEMADIRSRFGDLPAVCAGMVGSTRGWVNVPYVACPATLDDLAAGLAWVEPTRTAIVPGVSTTADIMRGEEVQLLGAVKSGAVPGRALLCQPGTHCKWAHVENGGIVDFRTTMTGEIFALLQRHSLLAEFMVDTDFAYDGDFQEGLVLASSSTPLSALFGERAGVILGRRTATSVAARVSGLLIGSDVAEQRLPSGRTVYILAEEKLGSLYASAVAAAGGAAIRLDSQNAFVAGISAIWDRVHER